jgi:L-ascorbate metabolism protein UlaG (beta-lactamase superfamily)
VATQKLIAADTTIPIHYDDYDRFKSPLDDFKRAVDRAGLEDRVTYLDRGDVFEFRTTPRIEEFQTAPLPRP